MSDEYVDLVQSWRQLWQAGFATIWEGYSQWAISLNAYKLGQDQVGQTPATEIWRYGRTHLLRYTPATDQQHAVPLLCVPSLINRYYILDLLPERSMVKYLVSRGLNVYMLDWGRPTPADARVSFDDHVTDYLHRAVAAVAGDAGVEQVSLLGYCQFTVAGQPVHLANKRCPLLNITSKQDETAPWQSVAVLNDMVSSDDKELLVLKGPHVGMVAGHSAPKYFWPPLAEWLAQRSGALCPVSSKQ